VLAHSSSFAVVVTLWVLGAFSVATWVLILAKATQFIRAGSGNRRYSNAFRAAPSLQAAADVPDNRSAYSRLGAVGFSLWLLPRDPALLAARLGPVVQPGQPLWDRVFILTFVGLWCGWLVLMALDAQRWRTSDMPIALNVVGAGLVMTGFFATLRVFRANSFASPVVRVQRERAQRVVDTGPYAIVRHPMYAAGALFLAGFSLAFSPVALAHGGPRRRLGAEGERRGALPASGAPGYDAYAERTRYRLVPFVY